MKAVRNPITALIAGLVIAGALGAVATSEAGPPWARLDGNNLFSGNNVFNHATAPGEVGLEVNDNAAIEGVGVMATSNSIDGVGVWGNYSSNSGGGAGAAAVRGDSNSPDAPAGWFQKNLPGSSQSQINGAAFLVSTIDTNLTPQDGWEVGAFVVDHYGNVEISGDIYLNGSIQTSSARFKQNIEPLSDPLDTVQQLRGVSFDWKKDGRHDIGVVAEEVAEVLPELVRYDNGGDVRGVDYAKLSAVLIEAVKAQQAQIEELKTQVARIDGKP